MSVRRFPEPETMRRARSGICKWCGDPVKKPAIYWHKECAELYFLHTRPDSQKRHLIERDGRRCAQCCSVPKKWLPGPVYCTCGENVSSFYGPGREELIAELWSRPTGPWISRTYEEQQTGAQQSIERVCALEVDHRVPLWSVVHLPADERRPYFGPSNLWLLCPPCHKAKSAQEAAERAKLRKAA